MQIGFRNGQGVKLRGTFTKCLGFRNYNLKNFFQN